MKKLIVLLCIVCTTHVSAQLVNVNPDPNGDPWIVGGVKEPTTPEEIAALEAIPELQCASASVATLLPDSVDNSELPYWPGIGYQEWFSCAQFAGVYYTFTYEINRLRELIATVDDNRYNYLYTYNFLNEGVNYYGSYSTDGWNIIKENGCPNILTYENEDCYLNWMNGYEKYYAAQHNKIDTSYRLTINDEDDLNSLKHWINDHGVGDLTGGLTVIYSDMFGYSTDELPEESPYTGNEIITSFGDSGGHAMTIVGYNDSIKYDFNGDGQFTNTGDIKDWEIGAVKVANSWGSWLDHGYVYVPYRLLDLSFTNSIWGGRTYMIDAVENYSPEITFKATVDHTARTYIQYRIGYGFLSSSLNPIETANYSSFNFQGSTYPMQGINNDPLENSLDFSYWYPDQDFGSLFLQIIDSVDASSPRGEIKSFSVVDYRFGEEFEVECPVTDVSIQPGDTTQLKIEYHLFPFDVTGSTTISDNRVVRLDPVIRNNSTVTISAGTKLDFYNAILTVEEGSTLIIEDGVQLNANDNNCALIVQGNIQIGDNVEFNGQNVNDLFKFYPENQSTTISNAKFRFAHIKGSANNLTISNCDLYGTKIEYLKGENLLVDGCDFSEGLIHVSETISKCGDVTIKNNTINNHSITYGPVIQLEGYPSFGIYNNEISFIEDAGISIQYSGMSCYQSNIDNNSISCVNPTNTAYGIELQRCHALVNNNYITGATVGVRCGDNSSISLGGNSSATTESETQRIVSNDAYQVYSTDDSFPYYFKYNAIYGDNSTYVYNDTTVCYLDIKDNYWGSNFDPTTDLEPVGSYEYQPEWIPGAVKSTTSQDEALALYDQALLLIGDEKYEQAQSILKNIITLYPETKVANASLQLLLSAEKLSEQNYEALKTYYLQNETIISNNILLEVAQDLANWCDVYMENYSEAIAYFEDVILTSENENDVIYAEINLMYTYLLMEEDNKIVGMLQNKKPNDYYDFQERRTELLKKLLSEDENIEEELTLSGSNQVIIYPVPAQDIVNFEYEVSETSDVNISVYGINGEIIKTIQHESVQPGHYTIKWDIPEHLHGLLLYTTTINEERSHGKIIIL